MGKAYLAMQAGVSVEEASRIAREICDSSLKSYQTRLRMAATSGLPSQLVRRDRTGSAENAVPKLFPAAVTEQRFMEAFDRLHADRPSLSLVDDRESGHTLTDFTLVEGDSKLPINVKNAGTRFENARSLVGLEPDDCLPIPAYKAYSAIGKHGPLLYVISADYGLIERLASTLPELLSVQERLAWQALNDFGGAKVRSAEDRFVNSVLARHWPAISSAISHPPFVVISARKAVRILTTMPERTPGIGLRAWGTSASGEVNVHISVCRDATPWAVVEARLRASGVADVVGAVNRQRTELVYDPEI